MTDTSGLSAKQRRTALEVLSRDRLSDLKEHFELEVEDRRVREQHIDAIVRKRSLSFDELLKLLKRKELKAMCEALGLSTSGKKLAIIIERILTMGASDGPRQLSLDGAAETAPKKKRGRPKKTAGSEPAAKAEPSRKADALRNNMDPSEPAAPRAEGVAAGQRRGAGRMSGVKATTHPLKEPKAVVVPPTPAGSTIIPAIDLIKVFSPGQWEDFTLEWAHSLNTTYVRVERCGGAGDLGRDVVAFTEAGDWHNYQCKHYAATLSPSDVVLELGKLCYYIHTGAYTAPSQYRFVAPQGASTKLSRLFRDPDALRARLIKDWPTKCETKITSTKKVPLTGSLLKFVKSFDFSIVDYVPPLDIIEQHMTTPWHAARFPSGLPARPLSTVPPLDEETFESPYIERLLEAYSDHVGASLDVDALTAHQELRGHLLRSRERFFHAESLRNFSRDNLPAGQFEALQEEFYDGVIDNVSDTSHPDGYRRVTTTTAIAQQLDPTNNALREVLGTKDKAGICHQLADDDRLNWVP